MNIKKFKGTLYLSTFVFVFSMAFSNVLSANEFGISSSKYNEINNKVSSMGYKELIESRSALNMELNQLEASESNTQNPAQNKAISQRIAEITAELSAIQKALVALVGVGAISSLTDDGYDDNIPPVITILGDNPATVELGDTYSDAGATAMDAFHGSTNVTASGNVDTTSVGTYTVTYTATDLDNNTATATRTVNVVDTTAPVITLTGDAAVTVELGGTYTDAGATASDISGDIVVTTTGTVDTDTLGTYTITYTASDASGNEATPVTRTVTVSDTTAPVITLTGDAAVTVELGGTYTDAGATLDISGDIVVTTTGTVDTDTLGTYTITYTASDASGNEATPVTRTVTVNDTTAPVFTSSSTFIVDEGETDVGTVTATDLQAVTFTISGTDLAITADKCTYFCFTC